MNKSYIYESSKNKEFSGNEAIILLPDIYMQTDYSKRTAEEFATAFMQPVFMLDYFYIYTGVVNDLENSPQGTAQNLAQNFKADKLMPFLKDCIFEIKKSYPNIEKFSVIGFCFGGMLSYIAGGNPQIDKVISFYGGRPNAENYILGESPIDYLISQRKGSDLIVCSFFGTQDPSIPEQDREKVRAKMEGAKMNFNYHEYDAGHAYFQKGRKNFNELASKASWEVLRKIFS